MLWLTRFFPIIPLSLSLSFSLFICFLRSFNVLNTISWNQVLYTLTNAVNIPFKWKIPARVKKRAHRKDTCAQI